MIQQWQSQGILLSLCPEVAGGLPTPRPPAEILSGEVSLSVKRADGSDITTFFESGAQKALTLCQQHGIKLAIMKQGSPSCGNHRINDGSFSGIKIEGQGVTVRLLQAHGIDVFSEEELEQLWAHPLFPKG